MMEIDCSPIVCLRMLLEKAVNSRSNSPLKSKGTTLPIGGALNAKASNPVAAPKIIASPPASECPTNLMLDPGFALSTEAVNSLKFCKYCFCASVDPVRYPKFVYQLD